MADNLQEALKRAEQYAKYLCRCGHTAREHGDEFDEERCCALSDNSNYLCSCEAFRPAPLRVSLLEEPTEGAEK